MDENPLTQAQQRQLTALLDSAGFGGVLLGMARLAAAWADDPQVQPTHRGDLYAVAGQLEDLARLVTQETVLV